MKSNDKPAASFSELKQCLKEKKKRFDEKRPGLRPHQLTLDDPKHKSVGLSRDKRSDDLLKEAREDSGSKMNFHICKLSEEERILFANTITAQFSLLKENKRVSAKENTERLKNLSRMAKELKEYLDGSMPPIPEKVGMKDQLPGELHKKVMTSGTQSVNTHKTADYFIPPHLNSFGYYLRSLEESFPQVDADDIKLTKFKTSAHKIIEMLEQDSILKTSFTLVFVLDLLVSELAKHAETPPLDVFGRELNFTKKKSDVFLNLKYGTVKFVAEVVYKTFDKGLHGLVGEIASFLLRPVAYQDNNNWDDLDRDAVRNILKKG